MGKDVSNSEVSTYYDSFKTHQKQLGVNIRHHAIYNRLIGDGLNAQSNVLEIGCGIGTVSSLILNTVTEGKFVGVDISSGSIEEARKINKHRPNAEFIVSDMSDFAHPAKFDYIVFPDVLEHIPVENHRAIFHAVREVSASDPKIHINIPAPAFQEWLRRTAPEKMQIIDQTLSLSRLIHDASSSGFELIAAEPYSLHYIQPDYVYIRMCARPLQQTYTLKSWLNRGLQYVLKRPV
jgi:trans-aconitate 2-methyltransferase